MLCNSNIYFFILQKDYTVTHLYNISIHRSRMMERNKIIVLVFGLLFYMSSNCMESSSNLFDAIQKDDREIVKTIVTTKSSCIYEFEKSSSFSEKVTSLHVAAQYNRNACLKLLLQPKRIGLLLTKGKYSPLHHVKNIKAARLLYDYFGIELEFETKNGTTHFMCAVDNTLFDVAEFFLEK